LKLKQPHIAIALLLLAAFATDSRGQSQQPPAQSKQAAEPPATDQRGTDQVPLAVKILPTQEAKEKADKEDHERQEKAKIDEKLAFETQRIADYTDRLALFTVFLFCTAVLQAGLFVWQLLYMRKGMEDAAVAARAAQASADIARDSVELAGRTAERQLRAYVSANNIEVKDFVVGGIPTFKYNPTNSGQTPARDLTIKCVVVLCNDPERAAVSFSEARVLSRIDLAPRQVVSQDLASGQPLDATLFRAAKEKQVYFLIAGVMRYRDIYRRRHFTIFRAYIDPSLLTGGGGKLSSCHKHNRAN
jgi:hypothetical protein